MLIGNNWIIKNALLITLIFTALGTTNAQSTIHNSMRCARYEGLDIPDGFLERAANAGYTHIIVGFGIEFRDNNNDGVNDEWSDGRYIGSVFQDRITAALLQVHSHGMTMIPQFASGNRHSGHFRNAENPYISWCPLYETDLEARAKNKIIDENTGFINDLPFMTTSEEYKKITDPSKLAEYHSLCHTFVGDQRGIDRTFGSLLEVIADAYHNAYQQTLSTNNPMLERLPFIHIGHDEPVTFRAGVDKKYQLLFGHTDAEKRWMMDHTENSGIYYIPPVGKIEVEVEDCKCRDVQGREIPMDDCNSTPGARLVCETRIITVDQHNSNPGYYGDPAPHALRALMAAELTARVSQVDNMQISGVNVFENTQVILYADMWDPEHFGGYFDVYQAIDLLPENYKDKLIFMPWQYDGCRLNPSPNISFPGESDMDIIDGESNHISVELDVNLNATGNQYDPEDVYEHFQSKGYRVIWTWAYPNGDPYVEADNLDLLFRYAGAAGPAETNCVLGYCASFWGASAEFRDAWGQNTNWDPIIPIYQQNPKFNAFELLANVATENYNVFPHTGIGTHNSTFFGHLVTIPQWVLPDDLRSYQIDRFEVSNLDYLLRNQNKMFSDCERVDVAKEQVSYNDAMYYCMMLSMRENLYDRFGWGYEVQYLNPQMRKGLLEDSYKNQVVRWEPHPVTFPPILSNPAGAYRLPTVEELRIALAKGVIEKGTPGQSEWVQVERSQGLAWSYGPMNGLQSHDPASVSEGCTFRVVRTAETSEIPVFPYRQQFEYHPQETGGLTPERWDFRDVMHWTVPRDDDGLGGPGFASTYLSSASPGGWSAISSCLTEGFHLDRSRSNSMQVEFRIQFPTDHGRSWRENNKMWVTLMDASGGIPVPRYRILFKPNRRQDQYTSYDLRLSRFDGATETTLQDAWTNTVTPHGNNAPWVGLRIVMQPTGELEVHYDSGGGVYQRYIDFPDNTYDIVTHLRFEYKTGTVADNSNYYINIDGISADIAP